MRFLAARQQITVPGTGWQTIDLTGAPYFVSSSASFVILHLQLNSPARIVEVRKPGSSYTLQTASSADYTATTVVAPASGGSIEVYFSATTAIELYLVGEFGSDEGVSFSDPVELTGVTTLDNVWRTADASGSVPAGAKWAVIQVATDMTSMGYNVRAGATPPGMVRVRKTGSTIPALPSESYYNSNRRRTHFFLVPLDSNRYFDILCTGEQEAWATWTYAKLFLLGYLTVGTHNTTSASFDGQTASNTAAWQTMTSPGASRSIPVTELVMEPPVNTGTTSTGWRSAGSSDNQKLISYCAPYPWQLIPENSFQGIMALDSSSQMELYHESTATSGEHMHYYTLGWFDYPGEELTETVSAPTDTIWSTLAPPTEETVAAPTDSVEAFKLTVEIEETVAAPTDALTPAWTKHPDPIVETTSEPEDHAWNTNPNPIVETTPEPTDHTWNTNPNPTAETTPEPADFIVVTSLSQYLHEDTAVPTDTVSAMVNLWMPPQQLFYELEWLLPYISTGLQWSLAVPAYFIKNFHRSFQHLEWDVYQPVDAESQIMRWALLENNPPISISQRLSYSIFDQTQPITAYGIEMKVLLDGIDVTSLVESCTISYSIEGFAADVDIAWTHTSLTETQGDMSLYDLIDCSNLTINFPSTSISERIVVMTRVTTDETPTWVEQGRFFIEKRGTAVDYQSIKPTTWGRNRPALLGFPFSVPLSKTWTETTTAKQIAQELCDTAGVTLIWEIADFRILGSNLSVDGEEPISVIAQLAAVVGGVLTCTKAGALRVMYRYV